MDSELCALIKRHVVQVDAHNRYLEKKRMWREYDEQQAKERKEGREVEKGRTSTCATDCGEKCPHAYKNRRESKRSHGILAGGNSYESDALQSRTRCEGASESSRRKWKRPLVPSFDVHEADRVVSAREKQRRLLRFATAAGDADTWLPDKFYTHELQQPQPWVNPTEVLSRYLTSRQKSSDDELTPRASTSAESSDHDTRTAESSKGTRRKIKKKTQKKRSSSKKKKKKRKKDKG